jgi:hypothetical protein
MLLWINEAALARRSKRRVGTLRQVVVTSVNPGFEQKFAAELTNDQSRPTADR